MATPRKKSTKKQSLSASEIEMPKTEIAKAEQANIDHLIAQALTRHKNEQLADKKQKLKEISHLSVMMEEYLSCFALIGYSLQDEEVVIFNMSNAKDEAALIDLLRTTFLDIANNRP